ncbi:MAG: DinB family protein [Anaerolineaceae bacterium]|nr:DinB family protein [Anaerolineaceae bacterium]
MESETELRNQLLALLRGGNAHMGFDDAVTNFPVEAINTNPPNVSYTPWHLLEHLRITQFDILEFVRNPSYVSPKWPEGYWPAKNKMADQTDWVETIRKFKADLADLEEIVKNPATNFTAELAHAPGYNILREIQLVCDHNAYHIGEFCILRQVMGTWRERR